MPRFDEEVRLLMKPSVRLALVALLIVGSSIYGVLVVKSPALAAALSSGYVAVFLSIFLLIQLWKKP